MTLRARLTLLVALCVAGAVIAVSAVAYFVVQNRMVSAVDQTLGGRSRFITERDLGALGDEAPPSPQRRGMLFALRAGIPSIDLFQVVNRDGSVLVAPADEVGEIPVNDRDLALARGTGTPFFRNATVDGVEYRVFSARGPGGTAIMTARSLEEVNRTLADLRLILVVVSASGILGAAGLGLIVAHRSLRPVQELTAAAEHVASTQDLSHSIPVRSNDEMGRLAASFNTMLEALDKSRSRQQQLVSDASHELRTPLTSLRTNIELLARDASIPADERSQILQDASYEVGELTKIVSELVELATDPGVDQSTIDDVRLDELVHEVVERARRRTGRQIGLTASPATVAGRRDLLERGIANLVDNARKFSEGALEVAVSPGLVVVRDHGPGFAPDDLPHVFERFYRSANARSQPGSGLGLAIVKQIAEAHGGSVSAANAEDGGAILSLRLPASHPATASRSPLSILPSSAT